MSSLMWEFLYVGGKYAMCNSLLMEVPSGCPNIDFTLGERVGHSTTPPPHFSIRTEIRPYKP